MKAANSKYAGCLYFSTNTLARKMEKLAVESWKEVGLSPSHGYLLLLVIEEPGIQPTSIVGQLQLTPSTITRLMEKLEEKKLIIRTMDGKITNVFPTAKAKALLPAMLNCVDNFYKKCTDIIGKEDTHRMPGVITKLADKIPH